MQIRGYPQQYFDDIHKKVMFRRKLDKAGFIIKYSLLIMVSVWVISSNAQFNYCF